MKESLEKPWVIHFTAFLLFMLLVCAMPFAREDCTAVAADYVDKPNVVTRGELQQIHVIVNKTNRVPDNYVPPDLVAVNSRVSLRAEAKYAFDKMKSAAAGQKYMLTPLSGFRTTSYQEGLYNRYLKTDSRKNVDTYSARSGFSEHHTGMAIDISGSTGGMTGFGSSKESVWIDKNAHLFGFIVRYLPDTTAITGYRSEPWHLRYVGEEIATDMKDENIRTLEQYVEKVIKAVPVKVFIDGNPLALEKPVKIKKDRNLVPVRSIFEALRASVSWDNESKTITAAKDDIKISLKIGSNVLEVNGNKTVLDVPPILINGTSYVPLRAVSESLQAKVEWKAEERAVYIITVQNDLENNQKDVI